MKTFFVPEMAPGQTETLLSPEESHHAVKVLRTQAGERVAVLNGRGMQATGRLTKADAKGCLVAMEEVIQQPKPEAEIRIALAMLKKRDRIEWFVEKAVELGASAITLFESEHTEKSRMDMERLGKIAVSALKQSGNLWLPELHGVYKWKELMEQPFLGQRFIAWCPTGQELLLKKMYEPGTDVTVLIGPEGDFSPKEVEEAFGHDFRSVSLGPLRLRAETAALAALLTLQVINQ